MPDLIIKPTTTSGNKLILKDQAGGAVLTTADSGATIANATLSKVTGLPRNEGLVCKYVNVTTVDIDADYLTLFDSSNFAYIASSVNLTAAITASGINGLDTGSEATSTWYHIYVIYNGTTVASLLSASATSPTMPSGYTYKKYVGAVYNDSGDDFDIFHQLGNSVAKDVTSFSVTTTTLGSHNVLVACPPTAKRCAGYMQSSDDSGDDTLEIRIASDANGLGECRVFGNGLSERTIRGYFNVAFLTANTVWASHSASGDASHFLISQYFYEDIV